MSLKHRLALLIQSGGVTGPRLLVELHGLSAEELRETMRLADTWPGGTGYFLRERAEAALGYLEPESVLTELLAESPSVHRSTRVAAVMGLWAKRDPAAALRMWEENFSRDMEGSTGVELILPELGKREPALAVAKASGLLEVWRGNVGQYGPPQAAAALCETLGKNPATRETLIRELLKPENASAELLWNGLPAVFRQADYSDPAALAEAMAWTRAEGATEEAKSAILRGVVDRRMRTEDPAAVADWYLRETEEWDRPARRRYYEVVAVWREGDLNGCGEWLNGQPQGPDLDNAIMQFTMRVAQVDTESALAWGARITDGPLRLNHLRSACFTGRRLHSRADLREMLERSPVSAADRERLVSGPPF